MNGIGRTRDRDRKSKVNDNIEAGGKGGKIDD